jgi:threonine dehydrogenase-like Zn-dependent dehydrogenase
MIGKAMVLEQFGQVLVERSFEVTDLAAGEVLVRMEAAGVCGSDVHMWRGNDPRTPLPIILGHEGIGTIAALGGSKVDLSGRALAVGDRVMWERGIMCGQCYHCLVRKEPALCPNRKTYGISLGCAKPPHFSGCYAEYLHLRAGCHLIRIEDDVDPAVLVAASCSGATAAHAVEVSKVRPGDSVLVIGPGPLGAFCLAMALGVGASQAFMAGRVTSRKRLDVARELGATDVFLFDAFSPDERLDLIRGRTRGVGVDVVLDCTGSTQSIAENLPLVAAYGTYALPGVGTPVGALEVLPFEHLVRRNVNLQGVWVSDTSHLWRAIRLVLSRRFPFEKLVTHRFPLSEATEALTATASREALKAVLLP